MDFLRILHIGKYVHLFILLLSNDNMTTTNLPLNREAFLCTPSQSHFVLINRALFSQYFILSKQASQGFDT